MNEHKKSKFYALMGCVTYVVTIALIAGIIVDIVKGFKNIVGAWPIIANFLNILAVFTLGIGISSLFFDYSGIDHGCNCDDI